MDAARAKAIAIEAGFDAAGVATLAPTATGAAFERWLERGEHAGMGWMERRTEVRRDPRAILEGARSALVVAWRYAPVAPGEDAAEGDLWPSVARYARGADYHDHMLERLERVGERLSAETPGLEYRAYVDTGPILERELAARAGLGAIGKNTNLLSPELGSWFLIGELLLTIELEPGLPLADLCGECTRCLEACPTGALAEPFRLDAGRCISFWTIEHRGSIPEAMRPGIGTWLFGCDVCQEVCPWNSRPEAVAGRAELAPAAERRALDLVTLLALGEAEMRERFRGSALLRPRPEGLRRNAAIVLGNRGAPGDERALAAALTADPSPVVRGHAAWALGRLGGERAIAALRAAWSVEPDPGVRAEIAAASGGGLTTSSDPA
jgi:epoxyqueuosine reductase